jgi:hypothetical protein
MWSSPPRAPPHCRHSGRLWHQLLHHDNLPPLPAPLRLCLEPWCLITPPLLRRGSTVCLVVVSRVSLIRSNWLLWRPNIDANGSFCLLRINNDCWWHYGGVIVSRALQKNQCRLTWYGQGSMTAVGSAFSCESGKREAELMCHNQLADELNLRHPHTKMFVCSWWI